MNVSQIYDGEGEPAELKIELEKEAANSALLRQLADRMRLAQALDVRLRVAVQPSGTAQSTSVTA
jgi:hypothetical protein